MRLSWHPRTPRAERGRERATPVPNLPVVLPIDRPLARDTAEEVADHIERLAPTAPVIIDLTAIPAFDSEGTSALLDLQARLAPGRVTIVGFRQAAARLVGTETVADEAVETTLATAVEHGWVVRQLRNLAVVQPADGERLSTDELEPVLHVALESDVAIVVVDLRSTEPITPTGLQALTWASSAAALRGQELLVVNVEPESAELLRSAGLSATTYVAPEAPFTPPSG